MVPGELFLGRYLIRRQIGRGRLGTVVDATDQRFQLRVAIKRLHPSLVADPDAVARFDREASAAQQAGGPHVVQILDEGLSEGLPFFVMELLEGTPLAAFLEAPLPAHVAAEAISRACLALDAAHRRGLVHGNIRAATIFVARLDQRPEIKLLDFGLERGDYGPRSERTSEHEVGDSWSDVRALGETLAGIVDPETVSPEFEAVLERCRSADTTARFRSANGLRDAILPFARSVEFATYPFFARVPQAGRDSVNEDTAIHPGMPQRRTNLVVVAVVALIAALALVVSILLNR